jgi:magnesium chelatase subunit D
MKLGLILNVIDPSIGGVLMMGHRGTGKSTAVRALADLLPEIWVARDCAFNCDPGDPQELCDDCASTFASTNKLQRARSAVPVVDLPLGATEDRVCGSINIEHALRDRLKTFEPGLLARANRGFLYIDEVNLLEDHLVDLLLDVSITGRNQVERENISIEHPSRFVLVGSGNPEEGALRPQLLDRFGLYIEVTTENDPERRVEIVERREAFERNSAKFCAGLETEQKQLRQKLARAARNFASVKVERPLLRQIATLCSELKVDGHRGELTIMRAARALAAFEGRKAAGETDVRRVASMALRHRLHRDPLGEHASTLKIEQALDKAFKSDKSGGDAGRDGFQPPSNHGGKSDRENKKPAERQTSTLANSQENPDGRNGGGLNRETPAPPAIDAERPELKLENKSRRKSSAATTSRERDRGFRRGTYNQQRGRYVRAVSLKGIGARIAVMATLRAAMNSGREVLPENLRWKQFVKKSGTLFIFAIDASGSMALNRINQAKGALLRLLEQSYVNRDTVAIVAFKGKEAEVLLEPSRSIVRARRALDSLTVGGGTPLSAGLACSVEVARRAGIQHKGETLLLLFTDGRANVSLSANGSTERSQRQHLVASEMKLLGRDLHQMGIPLVVIDTQKSFVPNEEAMALAENLGGGYVRISDVGTAA